MDVWANASEWSEPFLSFSLISSYFPETSAMVRYFGCSYLIYDVIFLCVWLGMMVKSGERYGVMYGVVMAMMLYWVDAVIWYVVCCMRER